MKKKKLKKICDEWEGAYPRMIATLVNVMDDRDQLIDGIVELLASMPGELVAETPNQLLGYLKSFIDAKDIQIENLREQLAAIEKLGYVPKGL